MSDKARSDRVKNGRVRSSRQREMRCREKASGDRPTMGTIQLDSGTLITIFLPLFTQSTAIHRISLKQK